jgi:hypothetical protein
MKITTMSFFKILLIFLLTVNLSCSSEYDSLVKNELKKNQKVDSLFFNLRLGETKDIYHAKSWDLNNSKKVVQGRSYFYMKKVFTDPKRKDKSNDFALEFTGKFNADKKLNLLDAKFYHLLWAPWNETYQAPKLLPRILDSLELWFPGNSFLEIETSNDSIPKIHVKIDGDRRFRVFIENSQDIAVKIDDLNEDN